MALLPAKNIFDGTKVPATTTAEAKSAFGTLRDFVADLLGTDSSDKGAARSALGVAPLLKRVAPNFVNSGAMVAQRTTAGTLSTTRTIGQCDNIGVWASGGSVSAGTITQIAGAISGTTGYACRAAGVTLTGSGQISHSIRMEARDALKYKNKTVSFAVVVDHDVGSAINYLLVAKKPTVANNFSSTTTIATSAATSVPNGVGTRLTFNNVAIGDVSNGLELEVQAACSAVTSRNFNVTEFYVNVEAEAGTYNSSDEADEFIRCCRYFFRWVNHILRWDAPSFGNLTIYAPLPVAMRATPTVAVGGVTYFGNGAFGNPISAADNRMITWNFNSSAAGDSQAVWSNVDCSAEL